MNQEKRLKLEIWFVLERIKNEMVLSGNTFLSIKLWSINNEWSHDGQVPSSFTQYKILEFFEKEGVLNFKEIERTDSMDFDTGKMTVDRYIVINQDKFDKKYKEIEKEVTQINKQNNNADNFKRVVCINKKGISFKDEPLNNYEIMGKRFNTVLKINEEKYIRLDDLSSYNDQRKDLVSKEINEINKNFKSCLKLAKNAPELIHHSDTSGYYLDEEDYIFEVDLK